MLTDGRFSSCFDSYGDKCSGNFTCAHEHAVSRPDVYRHAGTYAYSDECSYCHAHADFGAVGHCFSSPDGHSDAYEHSHTNHTNTHSHKCAIAHSSTNCDEHANSHFNTGNIDEIVAYACPHSYAYTHKLAYADTVT